MNNYKKKLELASSICKTNCPTRWCCSIKDTDLPPPPLCFHEVKRIENFIRHSDFYEKMGENYVLKITKKGYCVFFDEQRKTCKIYDVRSFDCKIFPFDFVAINKKEAVWRLWDCPYSQQMNKTQQLEEVTLEKKLTYFENNYEKEIIELWNYDNIGNYDNNINELTNPKGIRILRQIKISP
ncbi:Zinc/iron-chelating domain-containing protein [Candidatus Magnetomoraceae bacterium gMMP-1]